MSLVVGSSGARTPSTSTPTSTSTSPSSSSKKPSPSFYDASSTPQIVSESYPSLENVKSKSWSSSPRSTSTSYKTSSSSAFSSPSKSTSSSATSSYPSKTVSSINSPSSKSSYPSTSTSTSSPSKPSSFSSSQAWASSPSKSTYPSKTSSYPSKSTSFASSSSSSSSYYPSKSSTYSKSSTSTSQGPSSKSLPSSAYPKAASYPSQTTSSTYLKSSPLSSTTTVPTTETTVPQESSNAAVAKSWGGKRWKKRSSIIDWYCKVCESPNTDSAIFCKKCKASRLGTPAPVFCRHAPNVIKTEKKPFDSTGKRVIYVCFDVDSTGLDSRYDQIVKVLHTSFGLFIIPIAALVVGTGGKQYFQEFIHSTRPIPEAASRVSGIYPHMLEGKDSAPAVLTRFFDWLTSLRKERNDVIVLVSNFGLGTVASPLPRATPLSCFEDVIVPSLGFDFTMLLFEMLRSNISWNKLKALNLHFFDTVEYFKALGTFRSQRLASIYEQVIGVPYPPVDPMRDARCLEELLFINGNKLVSSIDSDLDSVLDFSDFDDDPQPKKPLVTEEPFTPKKYDSSVFDSSYLIDHVLHFSSHVVDFISNLVKNTSESERNQVLSEIQGIELSDEDLITIHHLLHNSTDGTVPFREVPYRIKFREKTGERMVRISGVQFIEKANEKVPVTIVGRREGQSSSYKWFNIIGNTINYNSAQS